ncbi:hypothetical protein [Niabella ginsenosidivorans]|uniref:hypothetical protein n=1 Tax=Niabella ginsenosidivorans TaxID=1176587 RepID=UPI00373FDF26
MFDGALVVVLLNGKLIIDATRFACKTSAVPVTREEVQTSISYYNEVFMKL